MFDLGLSHMSPEFRKWSLPPFLLFLFALGFAAPGHAACSSHLGKVVINEYNYIDNYIELKVLDPSLTAGGANPFAGWKLAVWKKQGGGMIKAKEEDVSSNYTDSAKNTCRAGSSANYTYVRIPFSASNMTNDTIVMLWDSTGGKRPIDLFRMGQSSLPAYPASINAAYSQYDLCATIENALPGSAYDAPLTGSGGNKDMARLPDGTGPWTISPGTGANSQKTLCSTNNALFSLSKIPGNSVIGVGSGSTFSWTITAQNGGGSGNLSNVTVSDTLPAAMYLSTCPTGATCGGSAGAYTSFSRNVGTLAPGASSTTTATAYVTASGSYTNTATAVATELLPGYTIATGTVTASVPTMNITSASVVEGNSGTKNMVFTVSLSATSMTNSSATYALNNGTATGGATCSGSTDFVNIGGTLTISAGSTSGTIAVPVCGDITYEGDESFTVALSSPVNAILGTATTNGTILNDDAPPLVAEYHFDEATWNGTTGEIKDSSGNGYDATSTLAVTGGGLPGPAYSAAGQSTCRYGAFDTGGISKSYVQLPGSFPGLSGSFSLTTWINSTNATAQHQRIFVRDDNSNGWALSLADGTGTGVLRFFNRNVRFTSPSGGVVSAGGVAIDTAFRLSSNTWYFVGLTVDTVGKTVVMYAYDASGVQRSKMSASFTGTWGAGTGATAIGGETSASAEGRQASWHFLGRIDEVRVYSGALTQTLVEALLPTTRLCSSRDHYELSLPTSSIACLATTATVTACADASSPCTNKDPSASGQTATLTTSGGTLAATTVTFDATGVASTTLSYPAAADGTPVTVTLSGEQVSALNPRQCCPDGASCVAANSCSTTFNTAGFIFPTAPGGGVCDPMVPATCIPTQVAGTSSGTYYLRAVKTSDNSTHTCGAALLGAQTVNLAYECNNPTSCYSSNLLNVNGGTATTIQRNNNSGPYSYTPVDMTFDASGNAPFTFVYSDVGQITLRAQKTLTADNTKTPPIAAATLTGSSNPFVVKPAGFKLSAIKQTASPNLVNPAAASAAGAKFVKAGEAFSATVTALTSTGSTAFNYGKETSPEGVKLTNALVTGLGLTNNPALSNNTAFGTFSNGVATGTTFGWDEVGIITLVPGVSDGDYLGTLDTQCDPALPAYGGATACPPSGNVGRFYAAQFALTSGAINKRADVCPNPPTVQPVGCNFTYMGEPMNALFTLTAQTAGGTTLQNYNYSAIAANNFAKLNPMAAVVAGSGGPLEMGAINIATPRTPFLPCGTTPAHPCLTPQQATAGTFAAGVANNVTVPFSLYRGNTPVGPYAALDVGIAPQDSDGAILVYDLDTVNVTAGTANHSKVGTSAARFGRLKLSNAFGSEKSNLQIPLQAQYWSGLSWVLNSDDVATVLTAASVGLSGYVGPSVAPLSSTNLGPGHVSGFVADGGGKWKLTLTKPDPAATGSVNVCVDLGVDPASGGVVCSATSAAMPWLQARWPPGSSYDNDPSARATFGIYSPETRKTIHVRELY